MAEIEESLLKRKLDSYSTELKDFHAEYELMVEITLNEYRELIKAKALSDYNIKEANKDKYDRESENKNLKSKNKELEMELFKYKAKYGEIEETSEDEAEEE